MVTKISILRALMSEGDWQGAIRLASRFHRLGEHRAAILDAHAAFTNPRFMIQLGKDIEHLKAAGRDALIERYGE